MAWIERGSVDRPAMGPVYTALGATLRVDGSFVWDRF